MTNEKHLKCEEFNKFTTIKKIFVSIINEITEVARAKGV